MSDRDAFERIVRTLDAEGIAASGPRHPEPGRPSRPSPPPVERGAEAGVLVHQVAAKRVGVLAGGVGQLVDERLTFAADRDARQENFSETSAIVKQTAARPIGYSSIGPRTVAPNKRRKRKDN